MQKYYLESIAVSKSIQNSTQADTHAALAQFAGSQYQQIVAFMSSAQFEMLVENARKAAEGNKPKGKNTVVPKNVIQSNNRNKQDKLEVANVEKDKEFYLVLAIE